MRLQRRQLTRLCRPWDSPGKNTGVGCHFLLQCMKVKREREVTESCPTLSDPMDCSPPGSSVHGIFQVRVLEWGAIAFSVILFRAVVFHCRYGPQLVDSFTCWWSFELFSENTKRLFRSLFWDHTICFYSLTLLIQNTSSFLTFKTQPTNHVWESGRF